MTSENFETLYFFKLTNVFKESFLRNFLSLNVLKSRFFLERSSQVSYLAGYYSVRENKI